MTAAAVRIVANGLLLVDAKDTIFTQKDIKAAIGELNAEAIEIGVSDAASQLLTIFQDNRNLRPRID